MPSPASATEALSTKKLKYLKTPNNPSCVVRLTIKHRSRRRGSWLTPLSTIKVTDITTRNATLPIKDQPIIVALNNFPMSGELVKREGKALQSKPRKATAEATKKRAPINHCLNRSQPFSIIKPTQKSIVVDKATRNRKRASHHP